MPDDEKNRPTQKRGPWLLEEDRKLMELIALYGPTNWVRIASFLGTRTAKQCRERYHQNLKPSLNRSPILPEEGALIEELVQRYGKRWAEIARHLDGRSDNAIKNWWNGGANRRRRASTQASLPEPDTPQDSAAPPQQPQAYTQKTTLPSLTSPSYEVPEYAKRRMLDRRHSAATILLLSYIPLPNLGGLRASLISFDTFSSTELVPLCSALRRSSLVESAFDPVRQKRNSIYLFPQQYLSPLKETLPPLGYTQGVSLPPLQGEGIFKSGFTMKRASFENVKYCNSPIFKSGFSFGQKTELPKLDRTEEKTETKKESEEEEAGEGEEEERKSRIKIENLLS